MENNPSTPKKLLQKVSQLILVGFSVLFNILTVYQSRTPGNVFFQDGVRRWLPQPLNGRNSVTINSILMILVSISRFWGGKEHIKTIKMMFMPHYVTEKVQYGVKNDSRHFQMATSP